MGQGEGGIAGEGEGGEEVGEAWTEGCEHGWEAGRSRRGLGGGPEGSGEEGHHCGACYGGRRQPGSL